MVASGGLMMKCWLIGGDGFGIQWWMNVLNGGRWWLNGFIDG